MVIALLLVGPLTLALAAVLAYRPGLLGERSAAAQVLSAATGFAASVGLFALTFNRGPTGLAFSVLPWTSAIAPEAVMLRATGITALMLVLIGGLGLLLALASAAEPDVGASGPAFVIASASALFVLGAGSPLGLVFAWLLLDIALLATSATGRHGFLAGQLGLMMALAALVDVPSATLETTLVGLSSWSRFWMMSAAAVRMGLYPVWWAVPLTDRDRPWSALGTRLAPTVAGGFLLVIIAGQGPFGAGLSLPALLPTLVSMLGAGALAWLATSRVESHDWQTAAQATLILMAVVIGGRQGQAIGLLLLVDLVLVRAGLYVAEGRTLTSAARAATWVLAMSAAGLPPTSGFAGRWLLYRELLHWGLGGALIACVAAAWLATTSLWDALRVRAPTLPTPRPLAAALALSAALTVLLGLAVPLLQPAFIALTGTALTVPLLELVSGLGSRLTAVDTAMLLAAIILPALGAAVVRRNPRSLGDARRRSLRRALRLTDAVDLAADAFIHVGAILQQTSGLLESRRAMAWTLLAAAATGAAMLLSQATATATVAPTAAALAVLALAVAVGALMVYTTSPGVTLVALASGYVLATGVLWLTDVPVHVMGLELLGGALVVAILGISALQRTDEEDRVPDGRRRLTGMGTIQAHYNRRIAIIAFAAAVVLSYGLRTTTLAEALPPSIVRPAMVLVSAGVLAAVFSRSALRISGGVLLALVGFEIAYAQLDPGLLITGGLVAFQLAFAVAASYFVGEPAVSRGT